MDKEGRITSRRQRNTTNVKQLSYIQAYLCSFKNVGKRGLGIKAFILTIQNSVHSYIFTDDPLGVFLTYLKATEEQ